MSIDTDPGSIETTVNVTGMTCDHCIRAVTEEISAASGVSSVTVDLQVGGISRVKVLSAHPLVDEDIAAAVDEAGYDLAGIERA